MTTELDRALDRRDELILAGRPEPGDEALAAALETIRNRYAAQPVPVPNPTLRRMLACGVRRPLRRRAVQRFCALGLSVKIAVVAGAAGVAAAATVVPDGRPSIPGVDVISDLFDPILPSWGRVDWGAPEKLPCRIESRAEPRPQCRCRRGW